MREIKLIKQHDEKDCGVACLSMVLNFYDTSVPISKLRLMSGTNSEGTSAFGLVQVFVLDKGQLVESRTHTQLRALNGTYEELWEMMALA